MVFSRVWLFDFFLCGFMGISLLYLFLFFSYQIKLKSLNVQNYQYMCESARGPLKTNMFFAKLKPKASTLIKASWESGALWRLMLAEFMYMKRFNLDLNVLHVPTFTFIAACRATCSNESKHRSFPTNCNYKGGICVCRAKSYLNGSQSVT